MPRKKKTPPKKQNTCGHSDRPYYARGLCNLCYMKQFRHARPQYRAYMKEYNKRYRHEHKDYLREMDRARKSTPIWAIRRKQSARRSLLRGYGLLEEHVEQMFVDQQNLCKICQCSITRKNVNIDHDHNSGMVRGLLCRSCNRGLGLLKDSPEILQSALSYLGSAKKDDLMNNKR